MALVLGVSSSIAAVSVRSPSFLPISCVDRKSSGSVELRDDWRKRSKPIPPGGIYPAKEHCRSECLLFVIVPSVNDKFSLSCFASCSRCGLCDTYYIAHVRNACAFLGDGMSRIEVTMIRRSNSAVDIMNFLDVFFCCL